MLSSPTVGDGAHNTSNGNMRDDTEASAPLLQTDQRRNGSTTKAEGPDQGSASLTSSIANLTNTIVSVSERA